MEDEYLLPYSSLMTRWYSPVLHYQYEPFGLKINFDKTGYLAIGTVTSDFKVGPQFLEPSPSSWEKKLSSDA